MRIAMVSEHASPLATLGGPDSGGQNVYVARLAEVLGRRGHQVTVYTRQDAPGLPREVGFTLGVTVEHIAAGPHRHLPKDDLMAWMPRFGACLGERWAQAPPDVVHAHFWMSGMAAMIGARGLEVPVVQTYHALGTVKRRHQGEADTSPSERVAVERDIGRRCDRIVATCTDEVFELSKMGVPPHHATVVPCGVDTERFQPSGDSGGPARLRRRRLLAIGRLVRRKGFDLAIRALPGIPDAELLIAGGPEARALDSEPEVRRLRKLAELVGVADRVRLLGTVPHQAMPALIRGADLVLCTPVYEPFGLVPLEAMGCAVPVVATRVGGHLDTVADGRTGLLVPSGDPEALAQAVRPLLDSPRLLRAFGKAGRERVLSRFTWEHVAQSVERVYAGVAEWRRVPMEVTR